MSRAPAAVARPPVHARHAPALEALGHSDAVLAALGRDGGGWQRTYGRFSPDAAAFATLVFEREGDGDSDGHVGVEARARRPDADGHPDGQEIVVVEAHAHRPAADAVPLPGTGGAAWLTARDFLADRRLHTIGAVLAGPGRRAVVRYRPGQRCTIRVQSDGATSYVKIHPGADVAALHANGVALWNASRDGRLGFAVARPDRFDLDTHALWQHAIDGRPLLDRLLDDGEGVALGERLGRALATLTGSGLRPAAAPPRSSPLERGRSAGRDLARRVPALEPTVTAVLARIETLHDAAGERAARPIHGAPHPSQWLQTGDGLALVDFDGFVLGDPELDIAVLQAEIEDERAPAGVSEAVVTGYEALAGPLDPRVLTAYRAIGRLSTARRRARAVRADGPQRAERALERAVAVLDAAGA